MVKRRLKNLWRGVFNFHCQAFVLYGHAYTEKQAKIVMAQRLAKKHNVLPVTVLSWMKENPDNFEIKIEREFEEDDLP